MPWDEGFYPANIPTFQAKMSLNKYSIQLNLKKESDLQQVNLLHLK